MKVKRIVSDSITMIYVLSLLIYILVSNIRIKYEMYTMLELSTILIYFAGIGILIYIFNKILNKAKFDIYDVLIFALILFGIIATNNAVYPEISLYGFEGRYEGLLQLILYYVLFLNCKNMNNKMFKYIIVAFIIGIGVIQGVYGILQFFDIEELMGLEILRKRYYSTGFEINSNFFGTVMIVGLSLSLVIYFMKKNTWITFITLITSTVLFLGLLCSGAMSCAVALVLLLIGIIILLFVLKLDKILILIKCLMIMICFGACYKYFDKYDEGYYLSQIGKSTFEIGETLKGDSKPIYGSGRIHIWKETLKIVPSNVWNGIGIDNFYYAFGKDETLIDINSGLMVDKVHNEYLQKLITEGIFSFIIYLILLLLLFTKSIIKIF